MKHGCIHSLGRAFFDELAELAAVLVFLRGTVVLDEALNTESLRFFCGNSFHAHIIAKMKKHSSGAARQSNLTTEKGYPDFLVGGDV